MAKKSLISFGVAALIALAGCSEKPAYNSNSGVNGSRDSASQLLVNTNLIEDISDPQADNEDWFYFNPPEEGVIDISVYIDHPKDIILKMAVMDGFGRTLQSLTSNHNDNIYNFAKFDVKPDRYFISLITTDGESSYTLRADFSVPVVEPEVVPEVVEDPGTGKKRPKGTKPAASASSDEGLDPTAKTIKGTVVLVTPRGENVSDIKISGIGKNKGVKPGAKAYLRGLNRKVDIYNCLNTSCTGTIKATSEELTHYDIVDVVVE